MRTSIIIINRQHHISWACCAYRPLALAQAKHLHLASRVSLSHSHLHHIKILGALCVWHAVWNKIEIIWFGRNAIRWRRDRSTLFCCFFPDLDRRRLVLGGWLIILFVICYAVGVSCIYGSGCPVLRAYYCLLLRADFRTQDNISRELDAKGEPHWGWILIQTVENRHDLGVGNLFVT